MHLTWLGSTAIKIQTKHQEKDVIVVIDPYRPESGAFPRSLTPDIALFTHGQDGSVTLSGAPFIMDKPGECEIKGVLITATDGSKPDTVIFRLDTEGISLGHPGNIAKPLSDREMEVLSGVDILFVPCDAKSDQGVEEEVKMVNQVEPRVVIPMNFKSDNDPNAGEVEPFLKEMGSGNIAAETKIIIKKKDLPEEEMKVMLLKKE
jgi:L-ascorbate metabolism protein UlaG (beta-lactamase superfamily)